MPINSSALTARQSLERAAPAKAQRNEETRSSGHSAVQAELRSQGADQRMKIGRFLNAKA